MGQSSGRPRVDDSDYEYDAEIAQLQRAYNNAQANSSDANEDRQRPSNSGNNRAAADVDPNFGWGQFWNSGGGGGGGSARVPLVDRLLAHAHGGTRASPMFPSLPHGVSLATLEAAGIKTDLTFVPYQMPRAVGRRQTELREQKERPVLRCQNPFHLNKPSLALTHESLVTPTGTSVSSSSTAVSSSSSSSSSQQFRLSFQFECLVPTRVSVYLLANEISSDDKKLLPSGSSPSPSPSSSSSFVQQDRVGIPNLPSRVFPIGRHSWNMTAPDCEAIDFKQCDERSFAYSHHQRYYPLVILMEECESVKEFEPSTRRSTISPPIVPSPPTLNAATPSSSSSPTRIVSQTVYCTLQRSSSTSLACKPIRTTVRVTPQDHTFVVEEIYGIKGEGEHSATSSTSNPVSSPTSSVDDMKSDGSVTVTPKIASSPISSSLDCVVCMSEVRDTLILPCRHMCVCHDCAQILMEQTPARCPIDRVPMEHCVRIVNDQR